MSYVSLLADGTESISTRNGSMVCGQWTVCLKKTCYKLNQVCPTRNFLTQTHRLSVSQCCAQRKDYEMDLAVSV